MALWTLPFLWIGVGMSMRRAVDAGRSAWFGMLFLVPLVNYVVMLSLAVLPPDNRGHQGRDEDAAWPETEPEPVLDDRFRSALLGIGFSVLIALGAVAINVYLLESYGSALFIGTPFFIGALSAYLFNHGHPRTVNQTLQVIVISVLMTGGALLLFALEGAICLGMALPPASTDGHRRGHLRSRDRPAYEVPARAGRRSPLDDPGPEPARTGASRRASL